MKTKTISDAKLQKLWEELGEVPFDEMDNGELILAVDWHIFKKGTEREEIWHWFDDNHSLGLYKLMGLKTHAIK